MTRTSRIGTGAPARLRATGLRCATAAGVLLGLSPAAAQQPDPGRRASDIIEEVQVTTRRPQVD